jgi:hypothetical protein
MTVLADRDQVDAEALALELASARRVTRALRKVTARIATIALLEAAKARASSSGQLTPAQQQAARTALNAAIAGLTVDVAAETTAAVARAVALALRQETALLRSLGLNEKAIRLRLADPVLSQAGQSAERVLRDAVGRLAQAVGAPLASPAALEEVAARAGSVVTALERNTRFLTNRALNDTTRQIAGEATQLVAPSPTFGEPPLSTNGRAPLVRTGLMVVWVAERDACLTCLALSGHVSDPNIGVGFDEFATFSPRPAPAVWPPGMPLMGPPRHPNCRCRLRIITADNAAVPDALRREAERSVARGWSGHDSRRSRLAADRLVRHANRLPRTVNERAAKDVARGSFSTRHHPIAAHLRGD